MISKTSDLQVFAADYPDRCLVTVVSPSIGTGMQFIETEAPGIGHVYMPQPETLDPENLDPSLTDWNADVLEFEALELKEYGIDELGDD